MCREPSNIRTQLRLARKGSHEIGKYNITREAEHGSGLEIVCHCLERSLSLFQLTTGSELLILAIEGYRHIQPGPGFLSVTCVVLRELNTEPLNMFGNVQYVIRH